MPLPNYYESFRVQVWQVKPDAVADDEYGWYDGPKIMGLYRQDSSAETRAAEAQGVSSGGIFVAAIDADLAVGLVLRRESDSLYVKITGIPTDSPAPAISKFKVANAAKTERPA